MSITSKIDNDLKRAMTAKDAARLSTLRMLKSALKYGAIEKKVDALADADAQLVIQKQIKQRRESADQFTKNGRPEMAEKESQEARVLEEYLPAQLSDDELARLVSDEVKAQGASTKKDFGRMMKHLNEKLQGAADAKRVSDALGKLLS